MLGKARVIGFLLAVLASPMALAQGTYANGLMLWTNNGCANCHDFLGATGLQAIQSRIAARSLPEFGLNYAKSLAALNAALDGATLEGDPTGMEGFVAVLPPAPATQRADMAMFIAGIQSPAPILSYSPPVGPVFPATAVGAMATQTVTVRNTGTAPLVFATNSAATIATGPFSADFSVSASQASSFCQGMTLQANTGSCTVNVQFSPQAGSATARQASLALTTTIPATPTLVTMFGNLPSAPPPITPPAGTPPAGTLPTSNSANSPSGGGALPWQAVGVLLLALIAGGRRRTR